MGALVLCEQAYSTLPRILFISKTVLENRVWVHTEKNPDPDMRESVFAISKADVLR